MSQSNLWRVHSWQGLKTERCKIRPRNQTCCPAVLGRLQNPILLETWAFQAVTSEIPFLSFVFCLLNQNCILRSYSLSVRPSLIPSKRTTPPSLVFRNPVDIWAYRNETQCCSSLNFKLTQAEGTRFVLRQPHSAQRDGTLPVL